MWRTDTMKIGVLICAFRERNRIIPTIEQWKGFVDKVTVACSKKPWNGNLKPDNTAKLALSTGATVREHYWPTEAEQRNWAMSCMKDMDWIIIGSPDMFFTKKSISNMVKALHHCHDRAYGCNMVTYWKNFDTRLNDITKIVK